MIFFAHFFLKSDMLKNCCRRYGRYLPFGGKIQYISDIHLDRNSFKRFRVPAKAPILVIAGDLGNPFANYFNQFFNDNVKNFDKIIFVPGNHEYYFNNVVQVENQLDSIADNHSDKLVILNNNFTTLYLENKVIDIVGSTLWSHIPLKYAQLYKHKGDFKFIKIGSESESESDNLLTISGYNSLFEKSLEYISQQIEYSNRLKIAGSTNKLLIVTHHAPLVESTTHSKFTSNRIKYHNHGFSTDLSMLFKTNLPDAWIFGHTHFGYKEFKKGETVLACNQMGFKPDSHTKTTARTL